MLRSVDPRRKEGSREGSSDLTLAGQVPRLRGADELHSVVADVGDAAIVRGQPHASNLRRAEGNDGAQLKFVHWERMRGLHDHT